MTHSNFEISDSNSTNSVASNENELIFSKYNKTSILNYKRENRGVFKSAAKSTANKGFFRNNL